MSATPQQVLDAVIKLRADHGDIITETEAAKKTANAAAQSATDRVDDLIEDSYLRLSSGTPLAFNDYNTLFDAETMLNDGDIAPSETDPTMTDWIGLGGTGGYMSMNETKNAIIQFLQTYSVPLGHFEDERYALNWSRTQIQFVVAPYKATSDEINEAIVANNIELSDAGVWASFARRFIAPTVKIDNHIAAHGVLFYRFYNQSMVEDQPPQGLLTVESFARFNIKSAEYL